MQRQTLKPFPEEPNTDTVPAMLTPGEFVIRKDAVDAIGVDKLNLMNNIDRLSMLSSLMEYRPSGYQEGGEVKKIKKRESNPRFDYVIVPGGFLPQKGGAGQTIEDFFARKFETKTGVQYLQPSDFEEVNIKKLPKDVRNKLAFQNLYFEEGIPENKGLLNYYRTNPTLQDSVKEDGTRYGLREFFKNTMEAYNADLDEAFKNLSERKKRGFDTRGFQEGGEVMLKTNKENLPNPGLKALFDSGAKGKEALANMGYEQGGKVMGYGDGGTVMDYYGGGMVKGYEGGGKVVSETLDVFGDKSSAADELNAVMALRAMRMQQGGMVPGMMPPQMPAQSLPPAGMMMQEGGMVDQPMPQGEPMGMDMQPMPTGERAFPASSPMEQLDLQPNEMMAYEQYGPETFRYMATKFKPRAEFTPYDAMVDAGIVDPYETSEDDFVVMTRDMANSLRGMNGV